MTSQNILRSVLFFWMLYFCFTWLQAATELNLPQEMIDLVNTGTDLAYHDDLLKALEVFEDVKEKYPSHPLGYFFEIAVLEKLQADYFTDYREGDFQELFEKALDVADVYIEQSRENEWGYFFMGAIQGYYGIHYYRVGGWLSAFTYALKGIHNLKKAYEINDKLWDIYYGLGSYYYWKSEKAPFLYFFGRGRKQDKERGLAYLRLVAEKGRFSKPEAIGALIRVLVNEEEWTEALHWINTNLVVYPDALYLYRYRMFINSKRELFNDVIQDARAAIELIERFPLAGKGARIEVLSLKARALWKTDQKDEAVTVWDEIVDLSGSDTTDLDDDLESMVRHARRKLKKHGDTNEN